MAQNESTKRRHIEKFEKIKSSRSDIDTNWRVRKDNCVNNNQKRWVKNLSDRDLKENESFILAKGFNYAVTPDKAPMADFITTTESAIEQVKLGPSQAEELYFKVSLTLVNTKPHPSNITKEERKALSDLTKDENIDIVPADKGRCAVVLNKSDYNNKCLDLSKNRKTFKPIGYNSTDGYRKKFTEFINKIANEGSIQDNLRLTPPTEQSVPALYGLPKIHKVEPIPLRPIISSIG